MKAIVNSVTAIVEDVRAFERRPQRERSDVDLDALRSLRERADSTLSNLATAAKTHATSSGLSPVSLLDAAASHLSATVTEICKTVCMRRATQVEQELFASSSPGSTATSGFTPALRSVDESLQRNGSTSSSRLPETSPVSPRSYDYRRRTPSENSSSNTNSPPPIFDQPTASGRSDGSGTTAESANEDNWAELKVNFLSPCSDCL
jgi:protein SPA2